MNPVHQILLRRAVLAVDRHRLRLLAGNLNDLRLGSFLHEQAIAAWRELTLHGNRRIMTVDLADTVILEDLRFLAFRSFLTVLGQELEPKNRDFLFDLL